MLVIGTTLWRRPAIEELTLRRCLALANAVVAVGSESASENLVMRLRDEGAAIHYRNASNAPLGAKHNVMARAALDLGAHTFIVVGSDDWLSNSSLTWYVPFHEAHPTAVIGFRDCYFTSTLDGRTYYWRGYRKNHPRCGEPIGAGRLFTRAHLETLDGKLWDADINRGLDASSTRRLKAAGIEMRAFRQSSSIELVAFKGAVNLWSFENFATPMNRKMDTHKVLAAFPRDERDALRERFEGMRVNWRTL